MTLHDWMLIYTRKVIFSDSKYTFLMKGSHSMNAHIIFPIEWWFWGRNLFLWRNLTANDIHFLPRRLRTLHNWMLIYTQKVILSEFKCNFWWRDPIQWMRKNFPIKWWYLRPRSLHVKEFDSKYYPFSTQKIDDTSFSNVIWHLLIGESTQKKSLFFFGI